MASRKNLNGNNRFFIVVLTQWQSGSSTRAHQNRTDWNRSLVVVSISLGWVFAEGSS